MRKQTELNSGERLGALTAPATCWVPIDLEDTALQVLATAKDYTGTANYDVNPDAAGDAHDAAHGRARDASSSSPFWTDTNNWAAQADPRLYPAIGLGLPLRPHARDLLASPAPPPA